ncbi:MAG: alpha/beta fold hydrolase [Flavobacteriaceae bacterium]|nr:alpha/beta fold hydrolase [Flavobacteriaceae bacterium]
MIRLKNTLLKGTHQKPILTDLYYQETTSQKPLVIFCHGYKGYKDWGVFDKMSSSFLEAGFALLKFNFSHNGGTPEQSIDFPDLEAFGNNNYTLELDDLETVLNWSTSTKEIQDEIDTSNITLIGHSRGGAIATLKAAEDSRIKRLVTWAAVCDLNRSMFNEGAELKQWKKDGVFYVVNGRTKQQMPHYIQFYTNYIENKELLNVENATKKINIPHLIFHGDGDLAVPVHHGQNLHAWNPKSELVIIPGANHVFGAKQPWTDEKFPKDFKMVLEKTIQFLK